MLKFLKVLRDQRGSFWFRDSSGRESLPSDYMIHATRQFASLGYVRARNIQGREVARLQLRAARKGRGYFVHLTEPGNHVADAFSPLSSVVPREEDVWTLGDGRLFRLLPALLPRMGVSTPLPPELVDLEAIRVCRGFGLIKTDEMCCCGKGFYSYEPISLTFKGRSVAQVVRAANDRIERERSKPLGRGSRVFSLVRTMLNWGPRL